MLADIEKQLTSTSGAFTTASARLSAEAKRIAEEQETLDLRSDALKERLVKQFTAMERAASAFKATQTYLQQQIDLWTNADNKGLDMDRMTAHRARSDTTPVRKYLVITRRAPCSTEHQNHNKTT